MGPTVILDKSAFQALSRREHGVLDRYFLENLTPVLGLEILADLDKEPQGARTAEEAVADLAGKFHGSGPPTNTDFRTLCLASLRGQEVPLDGRIVTSSGTQGNTKYGPALLIRPSPLNRAVSRWSREDFQGFERAHIKKWREETRALRKESLEAELVARCIDIPTPSGPEDLARKVDHLLSIRRWQDAWLRWMLDELDPTSDLRRAVRSRWKEQGGLGLQRLAPLAHHSLRVLLLFIGATRHGLIKWRDSNLLDVQYLY